MMDLIWLLPIGLLAWMFLRARGTSAGKLKALQSRNPHRVDVRTPAEFAGGHAPGSVNIPLDQLMSRFGELDAARPVLLGCASGSRSALATSLLKSKGFEAHNVSRWPRLEGNPSHP